MLNGDNQDLFSRAAAGRAPERHHWTSPTLGLMDIHTRQKWQALWPHLRALPEHGLRLLDAGTGTGRWALQLAWRRPDWEVVGLDRDSQALQSAQASCQRGQLHNLNFILGDFLDYHPKKPFHVLLSVCSAHYLFEAGRGERLFEQFESWLQPGGWLFLLDVRPQADIPASPCLPRLNIRQGISIAQLRAACAHHHLAITGCQPCVGRWGTRAKQLAGWCGRSRLATWAAFPVELLMDWVDRRSPQASPSPSCFWLVIAQKAF